MGITFGFIALIAVFVWMGLLLSNVRKIRKASERTATAAEYQARLTYDQTVLAVKS